MIPDTQLKTVSTEHIDSSTSRQPQDTDPSHLENFLAKHILDSTKEGMSSVLIRMDGSEVVHKRKQQKHCKHRRSKTNTVRYFIIKKSSQEYPLKSEGHQNTTGQAYLSSETLDETRENNTEISKTCHRQGSTSDHNRKISHKEDRK